jgi:hypothetical protein
MQTRNAFDLFIHLLRPCNVVLPYNLLPGDKVKVCWSHRRDHCGSKIAKKLLYVIPPMDHWQANEIPVFCPGENSPADQVYYILPEHIEYIVRAGCM